MLLRVPAQKMKGSVGSRVLVFEGRGKYINMAIAKERYKNLVRELKYKAAAIVLELIDFSDDDADPETDKEQGVLKKLYDTLVAFQVRVWCALADFIY